MQAELKHIIDPHTMKQKTADVKYGTVEFNGDVAYKEKGASTNVECDAAAGIKSDKIETILVDLSSVDYVYMADMGVLQQVTKTYKDMGISVCLTGVQRGVAETLEAGDFFETFPRSAVYYDIFDALEANREDSKS
ncbi:hypothetical protein MAR_028232 [Mya arenaria]|uniref:STAS domain-containing protein n=1 Tax=Mya arenaria TaxID=6604 RepID=A0ABY7DCZ5_MYAAR|nr:hypothetical protein MAR_028232 [Mya arenaria]